MFAVRWRCSVARLVVVVVFGAAGWSTPALAAAAGIPQPDVEPNDNRYSAGRLDGGTLTVALRAGVGRWEPEGPEGPTLEIEAFGEVGKALTVPAPLIRVTEGTEIVVSIRNDLDAVLNVHGLCTRDGATACVRLDVPPHQTREVRFMSGTSGTYHYWASALGAPVPFRELAGAFIVDDAAAPVEPDRILVITEWTSLTAAELREISAADVATEAFVALRPRLTFVINGLSWPATERFTHEVGERVRWRVINLSSQPHPLHLHGFHFEVTSLGDGLRDSTFDAPHRRLVVTQLLTTGGTMTMTWTPERAGNWLFHCHIMDHVSLDRRLGGGSHAHHRADAHANHSGSQGDEHHHNGDASAGMAGMVIGVTVRESRSAALAARPARSQGSPRKLTLLMQGAAGGRGEVPAAGFVLRDGDAPASSQTAAAPGPPIVLRRHEPVEITLVNQLPEATAIHWHGMELDSYYDGVHGWSGIGRRVTPMIEPGGSFVVRFTPPRAGTFIYHTHLHDYRQLSSGLYGPLIVVDAGDSFDPATDQVIVIGRGGLTSSELSRLTDPDSVVINGQHHPRLVWKAGARHRLRLINITPDDIFSVTLQTIEGPVTWKPVAKDGVPLPESESAAVAARQTIAVGETYDFDYQAPQGRRTVWLEVRTPAGEWQAQGRIVIR